MAEHEQDESGMWSSRSHPVSEDMGFQTAEWTVERIAWGALFGLVVLACLGLFSVGPLSSTTIRDGTGRLQAELDRFYRNGATENMRLRVEAGPGDETRILLGAAFLDAFTVEAMQPEPSESRSVPGGLELLFRRGENAPLSVYLSLRPDAIGFTRSEIGLAGGGKVALGQFIYP
ncbi:MAG: hypothetical protein GEU92_04190 [Alphaproteobacteria bacterium]|nr:hypothetical protein [Alphaproteobacteria bacterium]